MLVWVWVFTSLTLKMNALSLYKLCPLNTNRSNSKKLIICFQSIWHRQFTLWWDWRSWCSLSGAKNTHWERYQPFRTRNSWSRLRRYLKLHWRAKSVLWASWKQHIQKFTGWASLLCSANRWKGQIIEGKEIYTGNKGQRNENIETEGIVGRK